MKRFVMPKNPRSREYVTPEIGYGPSVAYGAGMLAGVAMTLIWAVCRAFGWTSFNLELFLGSMMIGFASPGAWILGLFTHLIISGFVALIYAAGFQAIRRAGVATGLGFSVIHVILAGLILPVLSLVHPLIPGEMIFPGIFAARFGWATCVLFLLTHFVYGGLVGGLYHSVHQNLVTVEGSSDHFEEEKPTRRAA